MPWERHQYRRNKVWVEVDAAGKPTLDDRGLASLRYKPADDRTYSVRPEELGPLEADPPAAPEAAEGGITITTAGAATGEPGPAGIGVVLRWREHGREIQRTLEPSTTAEARRAALLAALEAVKRPALPVTIRSDAPETAAILAAQAGDADEPESLRALRAAAARFAALRWAPAGGEEPPEDLARAARLAGDAAEAAG